MKTLTEEDQVTLAFMKQQKSNALMCQAAELVERLTANMIIAVDALGFYAESNHFTADSDFWDTVSGEPQNFQCDEAGTATVEDGSLAKMALAELAGENKNYSAMMAADSEE